MPTRALALALLVAGCGPKSPYPIENIELCGAGCISGTHPNDIDSLSGEDCPPCP